MKFDFNNLTGLFINGEWRKDSEQHLVVNHKYHHSPIAKVHVATHQHIDEAVDAAQKALKTTFTPPYKRSEILLRTAQLLKENREEVGLIIAQESGKPIKDGLAEVDRAVETFTLSAEEGKRIHGEQLVLDAMQGMDHRMGYTIRVPVGLIAAITPFNYPLNLVAHKVAPALAGGNALILKPASSTPLSAVILTHFLQQAGLPAGYINLTIGSGSVIGDAIASRNEVRMITFTGSYEVGKHIKSISGVKKVTLELGNNSPNIVHNDADLDEAARLISLRANAQAGQSCISAQRIYVHEDVYEEFVAKLVDATKSLVVGNPEDQHTQVGPLISIEEAKRVESWIQEAVNQGAKILCGGERNGAVITPAVVANVNPEMKLVCKEVFGPVVTVEPYQTFLEAIEKANDTDYGLQAGLFTNNLDHALHAARHLDFGGVVINDASTFRADIMPYGGVKHSGTGREGPKYAIEEMTEIRNIIFNHKPIS